MSALAAYTEWRHERKCYFELYQDSIRAVGKSAFGHFETNLALSTLDPNFDRLWVFRRLLYVGAMVFIIGSIGLLISVNAPDKLPFDHPVSLFGMFTFMGVALIVFNSRKVEIARFRSVAGVPMLDVGRAGKQSGEFDAFVSAIVEQIVSADANP